MSFNKGAKTIQWRKDSLFYIWFWENRIFTYKGMKLDFYLTPHTKINSKWMEDLNLRDKTTKPLAENIKQKLHYIDLAVISWI